MFKVFRQRRASIVAKGCWFVMTVTALRRLAKVPPKRPAALWPVMLPFFAASPPQLLTCTYSYCWFPPRSKTKPHGYKICLKKIKITMSQPPMPSTTTQTAVLDTALLLLGSRGKAQNGYYLCPCYRWSPNRVSARILQMTNGARGLDQPYF